jgi:glycosyltransferase involved in cell wall biosynthesis
MPSHTKLETARPVRNLAPGHAEGEQRAALPKPHICFVAPTTWPIISGDRDIRVVGGAEVQQSMIARSLARRGYRVSMICFDYGQEDKVEVDGVTIYKMYRPDEGIPVIRFVHPRLTSLWRALTRADADIYYQRTAAALTGFVAAFGQRHNRRVIYSGASDVDFVPGRQDIRFTRDRKIFEWGLKRVDLVIAQNPTQQKLVTENYGRQSILIPSCYQPPAGAHSDRGGYILWVATIRPSKQAEALLEIARRMPHQRFVVVGGGDTDRRGRQYHQGILEAAAKLPNVEMIGFVPYAEADTYFDGARVVLNTSAYEGFPNTFLQAWARGIPTVAFVDTGSTRDGELIYDRAHDIAEATWRLERLMTDDILWREASQRVASYFREHHSLEAVVDRYEHEVLEGLAR